MIVAAIAAAIVYAFARAEIDWNTVGLYLGNDLIMIGALHTLELTILAMAIALVLGTLTAVMQQSQNLVLRTVSFVYTWLFRGTPLLVQLLIWYNLSLVFKTVTIPGIGSWPMNRLMTPFVAALLGLAVNEGSYVAEVVRGGILSVDRGQTEAALAIGMTQGKVMRRIVLPQALRVVVPPLGNEFIGMLKNSSLAVVISYFELLDAATRIYTANFQVIELLFDASVWYLVLTSVFTVVQSALERRLSKGRRRSSMFGLLRHNVLPWRVRAAP